MPISDSVRQRVKQLRKAKKMSQKQLADEIGCSRETISDFERGDTKEPALWVLEGIADALNINVADLMQSEGVKASQARYSPLGRGEIDQFTEEAILKDIHKDDLLEAIDQFLRDEDRSEAEKELLKQCFDQILRRFFLATDKESEER